MCSDWQPVSGAIIVRNGQLVEISLKEYRELGGEVLLGEDGVLTEVLVDKSHAN